MMKAFKYTVILLLCVFVLGITTVQAKSKPNYLGEFCWLAGDPAADPEETLSFLRVGITHEGDDHFSVNGLLMERDPGEEFKPDGPITGNMEIIGDERIMTLTVSTTDGPFIVYSVLNLRLDGATLDGTGYGITTLYNLTNEAFEPMEAGSGEIQFVPDCLFP